ncbi:MAG TPA: shikimate kinase [Coriobacteriia bacterium]|nr:shikimate kinase [Coriobacteriia bacterium]
MSHGHIFIVGFMGAGKSTVGVRIAEELDRPFVDLDDAIEASAGMSVPEVFATLGEERFREMETEALAALAGQPASVVACGGGVVVRPENRSLLKELGVVLYLQVSAGEAIARIGDVSTRPLLAGPGGTLAATALLGAREALYSGVADACIDTGGASAEEVAMRALSAVEELL